MIGADEIISKKDFIISVRKPMGKGIWDIAIDTVGGEILSNLIPSMKYGGVITCCGNVAGPSFNATVYPFILRANQLIGIDSKKESLSINTGCLLEAVQKTEVLGTGGSKTIDFGIGLLSKLGMEFISNGETIVNPVPKDFSYIDQIKATNFKSNLENRILSDTNISLLGENSAFDVFGPQKGLSAKDIEKHKIEVERLITLIDKELILGLNPTEINSGAAGGLTFALNQILGCEIENGAKYFLKETNLINQLGNYDIGIFCEGKFDESSLEGKIIGELLKNFKGRRYFLGGQYTAKNEDIFTSYFQCGPEGVSDPKSSLEIATNGLIKEIQKY